MKKTLINYSLGEEIFSAVSHGIGSLLAIAGTVLLIIKAALTGGALAVVSVSIYGASAIILFTMSTLYHSLSNETAKWVFRIFDHCTIYLLISGTYTPLSLLSVGGWLGWTIFGVVWGVSILGIVLNAINLERFKVFSMISYIVLGWCIVVAMKKTALALGFGGTVFLIGGGVAFMLGLIFYKMKKIKYMHSIWHIFVLAGGICHFFCVFFFVL